MQKKMNRAFTVIELMMAISILSVVFILGFNIFNQTAKRSKETDRKNILMQEVRLLMNHLKQDIKSCRGNHEDYITDNQLSTPPIAQFPGSSPWEWRIYVDDDENKKVTYTLNGTEVSRSTGEKDKILAKHITKLELGPDDETDIKKASIIRIVIDAEYEGDSIAQPIVYSQKSVSVISDLSSKAANKNWKSNF